MRREGSAISGYVEAGYTVVLATLGCYAVSVVVRERAAKVRLKPRPPAEARRGEGRP